MNKKKGGRRIVAIMFLATLAAIIVIGNWGNLFSSPQTQVSQVSTEMPEKFLEEKFLENPSIDFQHLIDGLIKVLIIRWGFETTLLLVTVISAVVTMVLLAKFGIEGKWSVRGGVVIATIAAFYIGKMQPVSLLLIAPIAAILIMGAFGFQIATGRKEEISEGRVVSESHCSIKMGGE